MNKEALVVFDSGKADYDPFLMPFEIISSFTHFGLNIAIIKNWELIDYFNPPILCEGYCAVDLATGLHVVNTDESCITVKKCENLAKKSIDKKLPAAMEKQGFVTLEQFIKHKRSLYIEHLSGTRVFGKHFFSIRKDYDYLLILNIV